MIIEKKVFDVGPGEIKVTLQHGTILRAPVLGSCVALFMYDINGKSAGLAHVMFPSSVNANSTSYANFAINELVRRLIAMGVAKRNMLATIVYRHKDLGLTKNIIDSIKSQLSKEKIELQSELSAQSRISSTAEMDFDSYVIRCSSRYSLPSAFIAKNKYFSEVLKKVRRKMGLDLYGYKSSTLVRRMGLRMARVGVEGYKDYSALLDKNPDEFEKLLSTLAINVTSFFRNPHVFEKIRETVLPNLASRKRMLRVWSAGCATGEEAYSLAMLLEEQKAKKKISRYSILATDMSNAALASAIEGSYAPNRLKEIPPYAKKFAHAGGKTLNMPKSLKQHIKFARHDLTSRNFPANFDLVLCRNVLIFYTPEAQQAIMEKLETSVARGGYLIFGITESSIPTGVEPVRIGRVESAANIYMKK